MLRRSALNELFVKKGHDFLVISEGAEVGSLKFA